MPHLSLRRTTVGRAAALLALGPAVLTASVPTGVGPGSVVRGVVVSLDPRSGTASGDTLALGSARPLDLTLTNPYGYPVSITALEVRVDAVRARPGERCTPDDFATSAARFRTVDLAARRSTTLAQAGVPRPEWPSVTMVATGDDQDGCRGVVLELDFAARGRLT